MPAPTPAPTPKSNILFTYRYQALPEPPDEVIGAVKSLRRWSRYEEVSYSGAAPEVALYWFTTKKKQEEEWRSGWWLIEVREDKAVIMEQ